jgi:hypothetical protein
VGSLVGEDSDLIRAKRELMSDNDPLMPLSSELPGH